ncbi:MAG: 23S rRNA (pseudouridine(1915)-N(3))-methyltransferase RlmH [Desulfobulbaceae bacterium]|nr:23S rRNA (pseudouridine(1915)-N(3))-methyltransferase RlmH [Desulfobulbaceae bacterium]
MRFELLFLGKTREGYLAAGIEDFRTRLSRYAEVEIKTIKEKRWGAGESETRIREEETRLLLSQVTSPSLVVALDRTGRQPTSEGLAQLIGQWENQGRRKVTFIIGGPLGLAESIKTSADLLLSLSAMTFTHEMARLLLLEQLYRSCSIRAGSQYHK